MYEKLTSFDCPGNSRYAGNSSSQAYPKAFLDYASTAVPQTFAELLDWSEFAFLATGDYKSLFERLYNYFITRVNVTSLDNVKKPLDEDSANDWRHLIEDELCWGETAASMMLNLGVYGNDFLTVYAPIRRFLDCPNCGLRIDMRTLADTAGSDFGYRSGKFVARCVSRRCRRENRGTTVWSPHDLRSSRPEDFKIKQWPVREMIIHHYAWTDRTIIYWRIPEHYKRAVQSGDVETLAEADVNVLEAIEKNLLFKFRDDRIFHAKEPTITGLQTRGWGIPRSIFLNRQGWTLQLLRKNTQGLALDWVMPMKIVSPSAQSVPVGRGNSMSPSASVNHADFARMFAKAANSHRNNPTGWQAMQMPVDANILGGDANRLFPAEMIRHAKDEFLDAGGFPVEMYRGTLTLQTAPVGLRLFEATNKSIPSILNRAVKFISGRVSELASRDPVICKHERVTITDDLETLMMQTQMAMSGALAMSEPMRRMGIDFRDNARQTMRETEITQELQEEAQEEQIKRQQSNAAMQAPPPGAGDPAAAGGAPAGGGGEAAQNPLAGMLPSTGYTPPMSPDQMEEAATALAQQLSQMDPMSRRRELDVLRTKYKTFHSIVRIRLEQADQQMGQQGRQAMLSQG